MLVGATRRSQWNTISITAITSARRATGVQELASRSLTHRLRPARHRAGLDVDEFGAAPVVLLDVHNDSSKRSRKFRAGADGAKSCAAVRREEPEVVLLRTHAQTAGVSLMAQQPMNNVIRTTMQALAAVLGGTQSLHTNSYDETYALPTEAAANLALRTQQVIFEVQRRRGRRSARRQLLRRDADRSGRGGGVEYIKKIDAMAAS